MNSPPKPRSPRAVRLTPDALGALKGALNERWRADPRGDRLTHETRAEFLDVSVATAKKILDGKGVDRATLAQAFKSLGLAWDDAFCERLGNDPPLPKPTPAPMPAPPPRVAAGAGASSPPPSFSPWRSRRADGPPAPSRPPPRSRHG